MDTNGFHGDGCYKYLLGYSNTSGFLSRYFHAVSLPQVKDIYLINDLLLDTQSINPYADTSYFNQTNKHLSHQGLFRYSLCTYTDMETQTPASPPINLAETAYL